MPQRFGRFWLHEKVGQGGMAEIFRASIGPDEKTYSFELVVKRILPQLARDQAQVDMFLTEADVAKFLRHPNIVRVYEAGLEAGHAYIAMEYVWGMDLGQLMAKVRQRRMVVPTDLSVYIAMQVLRGLDYVHRARAPGGEPMEMVHRDINPSNIYVTFHGDVKLGDFGVARVKFLEGQDEAQVLKGKVAYMPPEALAGEPIDQRVDLWGVAATLYEMLTGRRVYGGVSDADLVGSGAPSRLVPAQRHNPGLDRGLAKVIDRALSAKPKRRPGDAVDFYRELKAYLVRSGVHVDAAALGRFARTVAGAATTQVVAPRTTPTDQSFTGSDYEAPVEMSPTQRLELTRKRRLGLLAPLSLLLAFAGALALGWWLRGRTLAPPSVSAPPQVVAPR